MGRTPASLPRPLILSFSLFPQPSVFRLALPKAGCGDDGPIDICKDIITSLERAHIEMKDGAACIIPRQPIAASRTDPARGKQGILPGMIYDVQMRAWKYESMEDQNWFFPKKNFNKKGQDKVTRTCSRRAPGKEN